MKGQAPFSSRNLDNVLVWEAGVAAVEPVARGRVFVDRNVGVVGTAFALVNPTASEVDATLTLRDAAGSPVARTELAFAPGEHKSRFVNRNLFPEIEDTFEGSLTFEADGVSLAAVTLRGSLNRFAETVFSTLPVVDLDSAGSTGDLLFPHVGAGGGLLSTRIILINGSDRPVDGEIRLFDDSGAPLVAELDGETDSTFSYRIEAGGVLRGELTSADLAAGYALVSLSEGSRAPDGVAIFRFERDGSVSSEAGVGAATLTRKVRIFVDQAATRTGVALANPGDAQTVTLRLLGREGEQVAATTLDLPARGHSARFTDELFPEDVFAGFTALLEVEAPQPLAAVTLKLTLNTRLDPILTTLPVADLENPRAASELIVPHLGFGTFADGE